MKTLKEHRKLLTQIEESQQELERIRQYLTLRPSDLVTLYGPNPSTVVTTIPACFLHTALQDREKSLIATIREQCELLGVSWGQS